MKELFGEEPTATPPPFGLPSSLAAKHFRRRVFITPIHQAYRPCRSHRRPDPQPKVAVGACRRGENSPICYFPGFFPDFRRLFRLTPAVPGLTENTDVEPLHPSTGPGLTPPPSKPAVAGKPPRRDLSKKNSDQATARRHHRTNIPANPSDPQPRRHVQRVALTAYYKPSPSPVRVHAVALWKMAHNSRRYHHHREIFRRSHRRHPPVTGASPPDSPSQDKRF